MEQVGGAIGVRPSQAWLLLQQALRKLRAAGVTDPELVDEPRR